MLVELVSSGGSEQGAIPHLSPSLRWLLTLFSVQWIVDTSVQFMSPSSRGLHCASLRPFLSLIRTISLDLGPTLIPYDLI